jgi:hypothetical protein
MEIRNYVTVSVIEVDTDPDPITVIVYVPAGVPFGLVVTPPPPLLPLEPQPAPKNSNKRANVPSGNNAKTRRLRTTQRVKSEIPRTARIPGPGWMRTPLFDVGSGILAVRKVVVMTKGAVEPAATFTGPQAAPVGNPVHVRAYGVLPRSVIVKVAGDPAETVREEGVALMAERLP